MSNLIVTCRAKKRTCRVVYPSLAKCVGCKYSDISRERYKEAKKEAWNEGKVTYETQYHLKPEYVEEKVEKHGSKANKET